MRGLAILLGVLGALLGQSALLGRSAPGVSGAPSDGTRPLQPAVQGAGAWRRREACHLRRSARGHERRGAAASAVQRRRLHRTPHNPTPRWACGTDHRDSVGLSRTSTDLLVRIESLGGATQTERLSPMKTTFVVEAAPGAWEVASTYLRLGIEHILFGFDHLLFVLALVILVRDWRRVALTVTAFTVAHSRAAAATLGLVDVPGPPLEAAIALSIVLVAVEIVNARHGRPA